MDNSIGWSFAICLFNKQAIRCQLIDVGVIRRFWSTTRFDFNGNDLSILFDEIVGLSCQFKWGIEKGLFQFAPAARIGIDNAPARESCRLSLAIGLPKEENGEKKKGKGNI